jgi:hypothetical protein
MGPVDAGGQQVVGVEGALGDGPQQRLLLVLEDQRGDLACGFVLAVIGEAVAPEVTLQA